MKKVLYGTEDIKDLHFDCCHGLCDSRRRKECDTHTECKKQLCGDDERHIADVNVFTNVEFKSKTWYKIEKAVAKWRKEMYIKCKPILMTISRP